MRRAVPWQAWSAWLLAVASLMVVFVLFIWHVSFQLPYGEWIRLFRSNGLEILDLIELPPAPDAVSSYRDDQERVWSRRWPAECIWAAAPQLNTQASRRVAWHGRPPASGGRPRCSPECC